MKHTNELYIPVPVDIETVKSKFLFGLTLRQIICFTIGIGIGLGAYFGLQGILGTGIGGIAMMTVMLPAFFFAVYEQHGEPMDVIIRRITPRQNVRFVLLLLVERTGTSLIPYMEPKPVLSFTVWLKRRKPTI